ncbi:hypothetical protein EDF20_3077 [Frigoribacterium sp. PhB116]|nr:hypothetical protein EDF18_1376 [Frigoribacterium sp. PhB107]TDT61421.1 hypothetical protein EDF20_3077 [Frigoribacterium sp. PhB116]
MTEPIRTSEAHERSAVVSPATSSSHPAHPEGSTA